MHSFRHGLLSLLLILVTANVAQSQNLEPKVAENSWATHYSALEQWAASVATINLTCTISRFTYAKARLQVRDAWRARLKAVPGTRPDVDDANEAFITQYVADQTRWRIDQNRIYPKTGLDFKQYIFDGEKYTYFDEYYNRAIITAQDAHSSRFLFSALRSNSWLGLGLVDQFKSYKFKKIDEDTVSGRRCLVFRSLTEDPKGETTVWVDAQTPLILRTKEITYKPNRTDLFIAEWSDIRQVNGVPLPFRSKHEMYEVKDGVKTWMQTFLFQMRTCEMNRPLSRGFFENVLRIGTDLEDTINTPNEVITVGGDTLADATAVMHGDPPSVTEPDVRVDGEVDRPNNKR